MGRSSRGISRRSVLFAGAAASSLFAQNRRGEVFEPEWHRYQDPTTDFEVYRITDPAHSSALPAYYNRAIVRSNTALLFSADRGGGTQAFRMDPRTGAERQLTELSGLDGSSLTFTPDYRSFCYFAESSLHIANLATLHEKELYRVPEGWDRSPGMSIAPDGGHALFVEQKGDGSRLRMAPLGPGAAHTVVEARFAMSEPIGRPLKPQILYRQGDQALWLVNTDGQQNRPLKLSPGRVGPANWSPDGKTILYLNFPEDPKQLNNIREYAPDSNTDKLVAKTSQYVHFGSNHDTSVFVGASRNAASPTILLLLRVTRRELTLCEHKASHPEMVAPRFSPDSQRIFFESDRDGKPAIYCVHVEKLVEKTGESW